jgi:putative transposase
MKKGRFTEEQIIGVLKQHEAGRKVPELAREIGVSDATIYTWKSKFGGMRSARHKSWRVKTGA